MNECYVTQVSNLKDGQTAIATFKKETRNEAIMVFHQVMASMYADTTNIVNGFCTILDSEGRQDFEHTARYENPNPILDPEPTPEEDVE